MSTSSWAINNTSFNPSISAFSIRKFGPWYVSANSSIRACFPANPSEQSKGDLFVFSKCDCQFEAFLFAIVSAFDSTFVCVSALALSPSLVMSLPLPLCLYLHVSACLVSVSDSAFTFLFVLLSLPFTQSLSLYIYLSLLSLPLPLPLSLSLPLLMPLFLL